MLVVSYCESLLALHGLLDYSALYDVLGQGFVVFCSGHETIGQGLDWQLFVVVHKNTSWRWLCTNLCIRKSFHFTVWGGLDWSI